MDLSPVEQRFVLHWGEMGTQWGVSRTVAQIHALLLLSPDPLPADEIARTLGVARSNASTSLRELTGWRIIRVAHRFGDRRDRYEALKDPWELFRIVVEERKRREIDPTLAMLRQSVSRIRQGDPARPEAQARLEDLLDFFESMVGAYERLRHLEPEHLRQLAGLG